MNLLSHQSIVGGINSIFGHRLPIKNVEWVVNAADNGGRIMFTIDGVYFALFVSNDEVIGSAYDKKAFMGLMGRGFAALNKMVDEAEKRGADNERKGHLAKIDENTSKALTLLKTLASPRSDTTRSE